VLKFDIFIQLLIGHLIKSLEFSMI